MTPDKPTVNIQDGPKPFPYDWPPAILELANRLKANEQTFDNHDMAVALYCVERLWKQMFWLADWSLRISQHHATPAERGKALADVAEVLQHDLKDMRAKLNNKRENEDTP